MKGILAKWKTALDTSSPKLSHKGLSADRGFLVYVTRTHPAMVPYLKGFHLTLEMWRGGRDTKGWKLKKSSDNSSINSDVDLSESGTLGHLGGGDEDKAAASHRVATKIGLAHAYAPADGVSPGSRTTYMHYFS